MQALNPITVEANDLRRAAGRNIGLYLLLRFGAGAVVLVGLSLVVVGLGSLGQIAFWAALALGCLYSASGVRRILRSRQVLRGAAAGSYWWVYAAAAAVVAGFGACNALLLMG